jgi:DNA-binding GntR family transcriptional regulator
VGSERTFKKIAVKHHNDLITALQANDPAAARAALCGDIEGAFQSIYQKQFGQSAQQET